MVRKNHAWSALKGLFQTLWAAVLFEYQYRTHKNTPEGLLIYAERLGRKHRLGRRKAESPGGYLRRLAEVSQEAEGNEKAENALRELAELLDRAYYGTRPELTGERCREYRSALRMGLAKEPGRLYNKST